MAITALLAPIPKWVLINNEGTVAGGGYIKTKRSLNKIQDKIVYQDAGMTIPWTNPIVFDLNGVQGPFYWTVDSANLNDTYYLEAFDADDNPLWTLDNYFPPGSGGGGGDTTTYIPLTNYIANNQFIDHIDDTASPIGVTNLVIAPSNHKGFTPALINPVSTATAGVVGPDIRFVKNTTVNTDQITFPLFALADAPLTGDVTPVDYVRYQCTTGIAGETYKCFQFPITQKIKNLSGQAMTFNIWARVAATPVNITAYVRQYFGSGTAASAEVRVPIGAPLALTTTWTLFNISFVVPDVAGKSIGTPGQQTDDDALYIQLEMPLSAPCDVFFIKPALYLGTINPNLDFQDYDQINSINSTPRTGDIKTSLISNPAATAANLALKGWVPMNDGSIGNVGSGATTRANADTFQLYKTIWDGVINTWAPVSTGRGATAIADFIAGKTLTLPRSLGRALAGTGTGSGLTARALGEWLGEQSHVLDVSEIPVRVPVASSAAYSTQNVVSGAGTSVPGGLVTWVGGGNLAHNNMQPTSFMNVFIKL